MNALIQLKQTSSVFLAVLAAFGLGCFAFSPQMQALSPPADGGYPNGNTASGDSALAGLTGGFYNSAIGFLSLVSDGSASFNTGLGAGTLLSNTGNENTATGAGALLSNTTSGGNTADGAFALFSSTTGANNTAVGDRALQDNHTAFENSAFGYGALLNNDSTGNGSGNWNTAFGSYALNVNTDGVANAAFGAWALRNNVTGGFNTAVGDSAALFLSGNNNTAVGWGALQNTTADANTATGFQALASDTTGGTLHTTNGYDVGPNTAVGANALFSNTIASANTAVGFGALNAMQAGFNFGSGPTDVGISTAVGFEALANVNGPNTASNTAVGAQALFDLTDAWGNVAIGYVAGRFLQTGVSNIYIGAYQSAGSATENYHTYIGNINTTSVNGAGTDNVTVDLTTGLLGHASSSRRYKENIKPMDNASEALYRLKPVTYRYKKDIDTTQSPAFGLIAEEVAEVNPALVAHNAKGQPESVHYEMVNAMLLNEFLKEHKKVEAQQATIAQLKSTVAQQQKGMVALAAQVKGQAALIQKVSAEIELSKAAPRTVLNNH